MLDLVRKLHALIDPGTRRRLVGLFLLMMGGTALEAAGISLVLPLLQLTMAPEKLASQPLLNKVFGAFGFKSLEEILPAFAVGLFLFYVFKNVVLLGITWQQNKISQWGLAIFNERLFSCYMARPYLLHLGQNSAEVVRNIVLSAGVAFVSGLLGLLTMAMEGLLVLAAAAVLFVVDPQAAILAACVVGLAMGGLYVGTRRPLLVWGQIMDDERGHLIKAVHQGLDAFKEIRLRRREDFFTKAFARPNDRLAEVRVKNGVVAVMPRMVGEVALLAAILAVIAASRGAGRSFAETLPVLGLFAAAGLRIMPSANRILAAASNIRIAMAPLDSLYRDFTRAEAEAREVSATEGVELPFSRSLRLENVHFRYPGVEQDNLSDVTIEIAKGQSVAFVGTTGAGKSTLADLIMGLLGPLGGRVMVDGRDIREGLPSWQRRLGYVPQNIILLDDTLRRNIAFGVPDAEIDEARVNKVIELAQVKDFVDLQPEGLGTVVGERGIRLSGGERQRIGIARALYHDPDVLILDEATSALDNVTERKFAAAIEGLHGVKTLIVIAHRLSTVRRCDRLYLLERGRLIDTGTFDDLLARNEQFRRMASQESR